MSAEGVVAIIQARVGSTRLPGKVLEPLAGEPMVGRVVAAACRIPGLDRLVVAIPDSAQDDRLDTYLQGLSDRRGLPQIRGLPEIGVFRGSPDDVLDRYLEAARHFQARTVVRLTADCPLLSPRVSGRVLAEFAARPEVDYASNTLDRTFPRGLDTEVFSRDALEVAASEATELSHREHVTPYLWSQPERFRLHSVVDAGDHSHLRWTVDTVEDLEMVESLLNLTGELDAPPEYETLLAIIRRCPELATMNRHIRQKELDA